MKIKVYVDKNIKKNIFYLLYKKNVLSLQHKINKKVY